MLNYCWIFNVDSLSIKYIMTIKERLECFLSERVSHVYYDCELTSLALKIANRPRGQKQQRQAKMARPMLSGIAVLTTMGWAYWGWVTTTMEVDC
jgi:hypothetical protein